MTALLRYLLGSWVKIYFQLVRMHRRLMMLLLRVALDKQLLGDLIFTLED